MPTPDPNYRPYGGRYSSPPQNQEEDYQEYQRGLGPGDNFPQQGSEQSYAAGEPYGHDGNAVTLYNEDKAAAEWNDMQNRRGGGNAYGRDPSYDSRDRYDDDSWSDSQGRSRDSRRRRHASSGRSDKKERRSFDPMKKAKNVWAGHEAPILGGAGGALLGNQLGGGVLQTLGGAVVGAVGAKLLERQHDKRKGRKTSGDRKSRQEAPYRREIREDGDRSRSRRYDGESRSGYSGHRGYSRDFRRGSDSSQERSHRRSSTSRGGRAWSDEEAYAYPTR